MPNTLPANVSTSLEEEEEEKVNLLWTKCETIGRLPVKTTDDEL